MSSYMLRLNQGLGWSSIELSFSIVYSYEVSSSLLRGKPMEPGWQPPDMPSKTIHWQTPIVLDTTLAGVNFGDCSSMLRRTLPSREAIT
ncbi:hypothetical protein M5689_002609 [Euphorbia peplus]|nr:hypothetical protein M5689_002609 [Euphorbia peplus]